MPQRIIYPVLNIYVGTSPTAVARHISRELALLDANDRRKVASLSVDTMPIQEERLNGHRTYGADTMQIIIPRYEMKHAWTPQMAYHLRVTSHGGEHKAGLGAAGAGGVRNNGHVAFCSWATSILQRINDKLDLIKAPPSDVQHQRAPASLRINIIIFLGGGTGSGILPALALLSRYALQRKNVVPQTAIYAILPEQPRGLNEDMQRRQRSNAFAALLELTSLLSFTSRSQPINNFWFGPLEIDVNGMQLVDVVYLYGHGHLSEHEDIYHHIGMDLFQRMQDGHGAGFERTRQLPDLSNLNERDRRGLPTCFATSGITEVLFPREEIIGVFARKAAQTVLAAQITELSREELSEVEKESRDMAAALLASLASQLEQSQQQHRPDAFDTSIIEYRQGWWEELRRIQANYEDLLRLDRVSLLKTLKDTYAEQIQQHVLGQRTATFDRYVRIYDWLHRLVRKAREDTRLGMPPVQDHDLEDRLLQPRRWPWNSSVGSFANYANDLLDEALVYSDSRNYLWALEEIEAWLRDEAAHRSQMFDLFRSNDSANVSKEDQKLFEEGRLVFEHPYTRLALPSGELVLRFYLLLLSKMGFEQNKALNVGKVLDALQNKQDRPANELSRQMLEGFFRERFRSVLLTDDHHQGKRPLTLLEIILDTELGGENLLRQHIAWGIEWARGHLDYNAYQEPETNGRIARQFDVTAMMNGSTSTLRRIVNEENRRSEVQNGLKLLESADPDRMTFLYTEYAIPLRAIKGMHEMDNSYLMDYLDTQRRWWDRGSMPTHSSNRMQWEVSGLPTRSMPLVVSFADSPDRIQPHTLYDPNEHVL